MMACELIAEDLIAEYGSIKGAVEHIRSGYGLVLPIPNAGGMGWGGGVGGAEEVARTPQDRMGTSLDYLIGYIRRGMSKEAQRHVLELLRISDMGGPAEGATAVTTQSIYNRLCSCLPEDMSPSMAHLVTYLLHVIQEMKAEQMSERVNTEELIAVVRLMCVMHKSHTGIHAWTTYTSPEGRACALGKSIHIQMVPCHEDTIGYTKEDVLYVNAPKGVDGDSGIYLYMANIMLGRRDYQTMYWVSLYIDAITKDKYTMTQSLARYKGSQQMTKDPHVLIWHVLEGRMDAQCHHSLCDNYFTLHDRRGSLIYAILLCLGSVSCGDDAMVAAKRQFNNMKSTPVEVAASHEMGSHATPSRAALYPLDEDWHIPELEETHTEITGAA